MTKKSAEVVNINDGWLSKKTKDLLFRLGRRREDKVKIGQDLSDVRDRMKQSGQWMKWVETSLSISEDTARRYIQAYENSKEPLSHDSAFAESGGENKANAGASQVGKKSSSGSGNSRTRAVTGPVAEVNRAVGPGGGEADNSPQPPRPSPSNEAAKVNVTFEPAYLEGSAGGFDGVTLKVAPDAFAEAARERGWVPASEVKAAPQTVSATALQEAIDRLAEAQAKIKALEAERDGWITGYQNMTATAGDAIKRDGGEPAKMTREARIARIHADLHGLADRDGCLDTSISREVAAIESTDAVPPSVRDTWDENKTLLISYLFKSITGPQAKHWRMVAMRHISPKGFPEATIAERMPIMNNRVEMAEKEKSELAQKSAPIPRKAENLTNQGKADPPQKPVDKKEYGTLLKGQVDYGRQDGGGGKRLNGGSHRGGF